MCRLLPPWVRRRLSHRLTEASRPPGKHGADRLGPCRRPHPTQAQPLHHRAAGDSARRPAPHRHIAASPGPGAGLPLTTCTTHAIPRHGTRSAPMNIAARARSNTINTDARVQRPRGSP